MQILYPTNAQSSTFNPEANPYYLPVPSGLWVQQTPSGHRSRGRHLPPRRLGCRQSSNKRVGQFYQDVSGYHNEVVVNRRSDITNAYINYTIRSGSHFDQTKIRLSVNNLFDLHEATGITSAGSITGPNFTATSAAGTPNLTYNNSLTPTVATAPLNGADNVSIFAGRSIVLSVVFGWSPKR